MKRLARKVAAPKPRRYRVFVSHSSRDRWIAQQVAVHLEAIPGVEVFLDEKDLHGGDRIDDRVRRGIQQCDELVVVFSAASAQSDWVKAEVGAAWGLERRVVVLLDKLSPKDVPDLLSQRKLIDLNDFDVYLRQVKSRAPRSRR
jgi:hypothetical protein